MDLAGSNGAKLFEVEDRQDIDSLTSHNPIGKNRIGHNEHFKVLQLTTRK